MDATTMQPETLTPQKADHAVGDWRTDAQRVADHSSGRVAVTVEWNPVAGTDGRALTGRLAHLLAPPPAELAPR